MKKKSWCFHIFFLDGKTRARLKANPHLNKIFQKFKEIEKIEYVQRKRFHALQINLEEFKR